MSADSKQVGGSHYKNVKSQHWDVAYELQWCYLVGAATKYLWRLGRKGDAAKKLEDVEKAIHYLEKKAEQLRAELEPVSKVQPSVTHTIPPWEIHCDPTRNYVDQG